MRETLAACLVIAFSGLSCAQAGNNPENVIKRMATTGLFEGHDEKVINSMGDAAAVILTKILAGGEPSSTNVEMSLLVLQSSFATLCLSKTRMTGDRGPLCSF